MKIISSVYVQATLRLYTSFINLVKIKNKPTNSFMEPIIELINLHVLHLLSFAKLYEMQK